MKKAIALLLATIFFVMPTFSSHAYAETTAIDESIVTEEQQFLEATAVAYIAKYVQNAYLYRSNDLTAGTISEALGVSGEMTAMPESLNAMQYELNGETVSAATLCERMASFKAVADYYKYIRTEQDIQRYNFSFSPSVIETSVDTTTAYVHIYTLISFQYQPDAEVSQMGDNYEVYFLKINGQWCIADIVSEEHVVYGLRGMASTYDERIAVFEEYMAAQSEEESAELSSSTAVTYSTTTAYDISYNRRNAAAYAYTYTTSSYNGEETGNNGDYLNGNFTSYSANCQNFASQCVWAGFGGCDDRAIIRAWQFPMNTNWHPSGTSGSHTLSWAGTDSFYSYITSSNCEIISTQKTIDSSFSGTPLSQLVGSVLQVNPNSAGYEHAVIITGATGYNFSQVSFCGNSPMRKAVILADDASIHTGSSMRLIIPTSMKNGRNCTGGTHVFFGSGCCCSLCGFNKLTVTATMVRPIAAGTTQTILASANSTCYRMAVCIEYGGTETWTEYTNTSSVSKNWTFSNTGLYTITIVARDIDPDYADSVTATHVFKIRVY